MALVSLASVLWIALCRMMQFPKWKASADGALRRAEGQDFAVTWENDNIPPSLPPLGKKNKKLFSRSHLGLWWILLMCFFVFIWVWNRRTSRQVPLNVSYCSEKPWSWWMCCFYEETAALKLQPPKFQGEFSLVHREKWCCMFSSLGSSSMLSGLIMKFMLYWEDSLWNMDPGQHSSVWLQG